MMEMRASQWSPRAVIVLILAAAVSVAHVVAITLTAWHGRPLSEAGGDVLIALIGAIIAIIAGYVSNVKIEDKPPDDKEPPSTGA